MRDANPRRPRSSVPPLGRRAAAIAVVLLAGVLGPSPAGAARTGDGAAAPFGCGSALDPTAVVLPYPPACPPGPRIQSSPGPEPGIQASSGAGLGIQASPEPQAPAYPGPCVRWKGLQDRCPAWSGDYRGPVAISPCLGIDLPQAIAEGPDAVFTTGYTCEPGAGGYNILTIAYDGAAGERWVRIYDGPLGGIDLAVGAAASPDGRTVYVAGIRDYLEGGGDIVTIAYDAATGAQRWLAAYDGPGQDIDEGMGVAVSPDGERVYVIGRSVGAPNTGGGITVDFVTISYVAATGERDWVARWEAAPGSGESPFGVAVEGSNVYVYGSTTLPGEFDSEYATVAYRDDREEHRAVELWSAVTEVGPIADLPVFGGVGVGDGSVVFMGRSNDDFDDRRWATVALDSATGGVRWVRRFGGPAPVSDEAYDIAIAPDGSTAYVTGYTDGDTAAGSCEVDASCHFDMVTVAYRVADGAVRWVGDYFVTPVGTGGAIGLGVTVSPDGSIVYVAGSTDGFRELPDMVTVAHDAATGERRWVGRYAGSEVADATDFAIGYLVGATRDGRWVVTSGSLRNPPQFGVTGIDDFDVGTVAYSTA